MSQELKHIGMPRRSGRYPWGSGENPYQRSKDFLGAIKELKDQGFSDKDIYTQFGMNSTEYRHRITLAGEQVRTENAAFARRLKDKGYSNVAIGQRMNINESSVRSLLDPMLNERNQITMNTVKVLKDAVESKQYIDIGRGIENHLGVSRVKLQTAITALKDEGYTVHYLNVVQAGTGKKTSLLTLAGPGVTTKEVYEHKDQIEMPTDYHSSDKGRTFTAIGPPKSLSGERVYIRYGDQGGSDKDGVLELRRNVEDISLGNKNYAQVRVAVDDKFFMKGMAIYSDSIPDGYDIVYNTNKKTGTPPEKVYKPFSDDKDNPFGATIKAGGQRGVLNIISEEGDWAEWSKTLSSQFLSKQSQSMIKQQLDLSLKIHKDEMDDILKLTNPTIKKRLMLAYSDDLDAAAVHLKAAALPRQASHVLLPVPSLSDKEVYARNYQDGEEVILVRYPHGGIFEIPVLKVNNRNKEARSTIGNQAIDAIGINPKVAQQLSGADFDGDTVLVIPTRNQKFKTSQPLKELQNFDPQSYYKLPDSAPKMKSDTKQNEMGKISNLITDMTIQGAPLEEISRAVRHSMVVIDAEKHHLNYKQSFEDHRIGELKAKYQGSTKAGASTLISRASSDKRVEQRSEYYDIDPDTGAKIYKKTGAVYQKPIKKDGVIVGWGPEKPRLTKTSRMAEVTDAFELSSGTVQESLYAQYANALKGMANDLRKQSISVPNLEYSPTANRVYAKEVESLKAKLNIAERNAPLERKAQVIAEREIRIKSQDPSLDKDKLKKLKGQAITKARAQVGANKDNIPITPKEWDAIQAGAITNNTLSKILNNTDLDLIKKYATPRETVQLSPVKVSRIKSMVRAGYSQADIASALGISVSTVIKNLE